MRHLLIVAGILALAVSASLTPANAAGPVGYCGNLRCACQFQCRVEFWNTEKLWDRANRHSRPLTQACIDKCVAAKEAARR
jgi:hypothetical protein